MVVIIRAWKLFGLTAAALLHHPPLQTALFGVLLWVPLLERESCSLHPKQQWRRRSFLLSPTKPSLTRKNKFVVPAAAFLLLTVAYYCFSLKDIQVLRETFKDNEVVQKMDDSYLLRYLRARNNVQESTKIITETIVLSPPPQNKDPLWQFCCYLIPPKAWKAEYKPETLRFDKQSFEVPLKAGVTFLHKHDKWGRPCLVLFPSRHFPKDTTVEATFRCCVYYLEKIEKMYSGLQFLFSVFSSLLFLLIS